MKQAFNAAIDDLDLDPVEFRAYCHILRRGECWESIAKQAEHCKVSESTYRRAVKRLVYDHKIIVFVERPGMTTVYQALPFAEQKHAVQMPSTPSSNDTPPLADLTPTPSKFDRGGVSNTTGVPLADLTPKVLPSEVNTQEGERGKVEQFVEPFERSSDEAFQTVARIVKSEVGFLSRRGFDFDAAVKRWGDLLPDVWEICFRAPNRKPDDLPIYRFEDACNRKFDTGLVPKQREASAQVARSPENPSFERFEQVQTPRGDTWTIVDIAPNGLVAFEETDEIWFARDLTPLRVAAA